MNGDDADTQRRQMQHNVYTIKSATSFSLVSKPGEPGCVYFLSMVANVQQGDVLQWIDEARQ